MTQGSVITGGAVVLLTVSLATVTQAQTANNPGDIDEIVVTATRVEKAARTIPAAVGVIDRDDIQLARQQIGLDEALVNIPGIFLQNRFNFAQDLRVSIRGFGARANFGIRGVKIIVDGIPETLPDGQGGVDSIDLGSTQRVEVIRGAASSLYGNASGGVISITSEAGDEKPMLETRISGGDYGFRKLQLKTAGELSRVNYMVSVSDSSYDGYRDHSEAENTQVNSRFRLALDDTSELMAVFNITDQPVSNDAGGINRAQADADPRSARDVNVNLNAGEALDQQKIGFTYRKSFSDSHELAVRNYYVWRNFDARLPVTGSGIIELDRFFYGGGFTYTYTGNLAGKPNRLSAGVDLERQDDDRERFDNLNGLAGDRVLNQNEQVTSTGVYVQNETSLTDTVELTVGLRHDRVEFDVTDRFNDDGDDSGKRSITETSPMLGLSVQLGPATNVYGNVSTSFETPTTTEFANPAGGGFNPSLAPQTARNYEIGLKGALGDVSSYTAAIYKIDVDDELIPFELASSPGRDFFQNAGKSSRNGVELSFETRPVEGLSASVAYTYSDFTFDSFMDDNGNDFAGNVIPGTPEHILHGELTYRHAAGYFGQVDTLFIDDQFVNNANTDKVDSYSLTNVRLGYSAVVGAWAISPFAGINNLFDEAYTSNARINAFGGRYFEPGPDRNIYGGVTLRYNFQ